jgi:transglutaminase-like putative cysteine protease
MKLSIKYLIILVLTISHNVHAQNYSFEAIPNWVKMIDIPDESAISKYDITTGFYLKLADYQVNLNENAFFSHEIRNVISYSGITQASQLLVAYDTSYQHLQIHHLIIWRKGIKIDRTNDLSFEVMNNEYSLQQGIYTGAISVYDNLDDIRKDDLVDFAYTLIGNNPIFNEDKYLFIPLAAMNPIDLYNVRILYSKEKEYSYKCVDCDSLKIVNEVIDNYRHIEISYSNLRPIELEVNIPSWVTPYKYFTLSSYKSWKDVNIWAQGVFSLQNKPDLDDVYNEVFTGNETIEQKISKLIDYVQDDIRYMGIQSGIGSIKPFSPEQVVKQRFGDCKDKSLLLVWLLKNIGVEKAYPALVNTVTQSEVDKYLVSNQIFNHCIVTYEYNNNTYWVDPSIAIQGGNYKDLYTYNYGKALVIGQPADTLQSMSVTNKEGMTNYIDEYTFKSFTEPGKLLITSERSGFEADTRRLLIEYYSVNNVADGLSNELKMQFPIVNKTSEVKIDDDIETNTFTMTYSYDVGGMWQDGDNTNPPAKGFWIFRFEPRTLYQYINTSVCEDRKYDFALSYPQNVHYRIVFEFHKDMLIDDYFKTYDNEAFYFEEKVEQLNSHSIQINYSFMTKKNNIKADAYKEACEQKNEIVQKLPLVIYFPK